jgi:hypothetical protein
MRRCFVCRRILTFWRSFIFLSAKGFVDLSLVGQNLRLRDLHSPIFCLFLLSGGQVSPRRDILPLGFEEGCYVPPVTFKCGDLYVMGWVLDWWRHDFPSRTIDDLVDFLVYDYCSELRIFSSSEVRFVREP